MKSPLGKKLMKLGLNKGEAEEDWDHHISVHIDGLTQAAKDMKDMRACYDGLLSAAAASANSAYEFSESLMEMGNCLLEKTAMPDDGERGGALSLLGRVQLELQKLVDSYRSHIIMTITHPSESLLSELRKVEEMKLQCDEKREVFEYMLGQFREKRKSRHAKGETFTSEQLQAVREEYDEAARLCIFRVESLKQGQSLSLLTQAARHHAAQLNFFRKGFQSLEAVEPHIRNIAEKQHIDYELSELNDRDSFETNDDGELSFDYSLNKKEFENSATSRNSMELDHLGGPSSQTSQMKNLEAQISFGRNQGDVIFSEQRRAGSHSAPLHASEKFDPGERIREMRSCVQKYSRHVLPTPGDAKGSMNSSTPLSSTTISGGISKNLWHSSPLDIEKQKKIVEDHISARNFSKSQVSADDNSNKKHFLPLPPTVPLSDTRIGSDSQKIKRQAFSGPIVSKSSYNKQPLVPTSGPINSTEFSGLHGSMSGSQPPSSLNVSQNVPPPPVSSPKISELHELPRPPESFGSKPMHSAGAIGHSAPLVSRTREISPTNRNRFVSSKEGSPLPLPQLTVSRSFSIPSSSQRAATLHSGKAPESSQTVQRTDKVPSPPLTPISLSNMKSPNSGQIRGKVNNFSS
ncbi:hypothetical protein C2S53_005893 [Perilla frutescens var. hirtella]|uniref:BAR domain-containing protein n=1 Tax=Perilla frutescens var. hirtella TaxID=608512 RepID=A0AAD4P654_PERFH|nr:hypothetical protein C2S53_005893 [Perilla frutescens var. hirtella]